jgi:hypothetical protein
MPKHLAKVAARLRREAKKNPHINEEKEMAERLEKYLTPALSRIYNEGGPIISSPWEGFTVSAKVTLTAITSLAKVIMFRPLYFAQTGCPSCHQQYSDLVLTFGFWYSDTDIPFSTSASIDRTVTFLLRCLTVNILPLQLARSVPDAERKNVAKGGPAK